MIESDPDKYEMVGVWPNDGEEIARWFTQPSGEWEVHGVHTGYGSILICRRKGCDERAFLPINESGDDLDWSALDTWTFGPVDDRGSEGWLCPVHGMEQQ